MVKLLSGYIRKQIASKMGKHLLPATLTKVIAGTRTPGAVSGGVQPTTVDYACRGMVSDYREDQIDGTNITREDRKVMLLGGTIGGGQRPTKNDRVTIADYAGAAPQTYVIQHVDVDPDGAAFDCQVRR